MKSNVKGLIQLFLRAAVVPRYVFLSSAFAIRVVKSRNILILKYHRQHIPPDVFFPFSFLFVSVFSFLSPYYSRVAVFVLETHNPCGTILEKRLPASG